MGVIASETELGVPTKWMSRPRNRVAIKGPKGANEWAVDNECPAAGTGFSVLCRRAGICRHLLARVAGTVSVFKSNVTIEACNFPVTALSFPRKIRRERGTSKIVSHGGEDRR